MEKEASMCKGLLENSRRKPTNGRIAEKGAVNSVLGLMTLGMEV